MIKKIIIGVAVLAVVFLAGWKLFYSPNENSISFDEVRENLNAYHMEATMELNENDEKKNYFVTVDYQKKEEEQNFRISLLDTNLNQEQILLRNKDGVFVLSPLLNQVYKFKGDYPLNSPKPYLYHSMLDAMKEDHELKTMDDGYLLSFKPTYEHRNKWVKEDIKLSKDLKPLWVNIYDDNASLMATVLFSKVDLNPSYSEDFFNVDTNMNKARENLSTSTSSIEDLPYLPLVNVVSSTLKEQVEATAGGEKIFILTYEGDKNYRVIQKILTPSSDLVSIEYPGEYIETTFGIGYTRNKYFTYIVGNVCYEVYSSDLEMDEMVSVVSSMEISAKK